MKKKSIKNNIRRTLDIVFDVVAVFVVLFSISITILTLTSHRGGRGVFGFSFGIVQSNSMLASGILKGDVMTIKKQDEYQVGDIIAFIRAPQLYDKLASEVDTQEAKIWVHEIIKIKTDKFGRQTYLTKGSSNNIHDRAYVPQDFVVGKASKLPKMFNNFMRFISSRKGIICLVIIPCGLILMYQTYILIDEIYKLKDNKYNEIPPFEGKEGEKNAVEKEKTQ